MNTKQIGAISETACLAKFVELGWAVYLPYGDNARADMIIERPGVGRCEKVQVKTARLRNGKLQASCCSSYEHRGRRAKGYVGEVDWFAFYSPDLRQVYMVRPEDVGKNMVTFRLSKTQNNQQKGVRIAQDYQIEKLKSPDS